MSPGRRLLDSFWWVAGPLPLKTIGAAQEWEFGDVIAFALRCAGVMPRVVCVWLNSPMLVSSKEATDGDSPLCSGEWSEVPSLPEMSLGLFPAGDLKGLTLPVIILRTSQRPQERQDSYPGSFSSAS